VSIDEKVALLSASRPADEILTSTSFGNRVETVAMASDGTLFAADSDGVSIFRGSPRVFVTELTMEFDNPQALIVVE
jgi:hypothetical protein